MGGAMRGLKVAVAVMGVLIVAGTATLLVLLVNQVGGTPNAAGIVLDEPAGTRIAATSATRGQVVLQLQGGGPDRIVIVDLRAGRAVSRVGLSR